MRRAGRRRSGERFGLAVVDGIAELPVGVRGDLASGTDREYVSGFNLLDVGVDALGREVVAAPDEADQCVAIDCGAKGWVAA
jgi:hypothetical protein